MLQSIHTKAGKGLMKIIIITSLLELENLLFKKATWLIAMAYTLFSIVICISENLRQSYFSLTESVPVTLYNFVLPFVLVFILMSALSPVFAGDREHRIEQIPLTCLIGRKGRSISKLIGAVLFSLIICMSLILDTLIICSFFGLIDGNVLINNISSESTQLILEPLWTAWQHIGFSAISLIIGSILSALLMLFVSCSTKNTLSSVSICGIIILFEYLINRFSFPTIIQEYNIWVFLQPYYLFVMEIINISPLINLFLLSLAFLPFCIFAVWQISKKGV